MRKFKIHGIKFAPFLKRVANLRIIFLRHLILKGLVPIMQHISWIFRNTPTFSLSDGFQGSYGFVHKVPFFGSPWIYKALVKHSLHVCVRPICLPTPTSGRIGTDATHALADKIVLFGRNLGMVKAKIIDKDLCRASCCQTKTDQVCATKVENTNDKEDKCTERDIGAPLIMTENGRCVKNHFITPILWIISFSHTIIGINTGSNCVRNWPEIFTSFLFDSVWTWVWTIVSDAEGQPGPIGSGIGRVEFSSCKHYAGNLPIVPLKSSLAVSFRF